MTAGPQTHRIGEFVGGKYHILRMLAQGGMGVVYEAQHAVVKRRFAVKFLRADLAARREILIRFHREAQAAGALESENIAAAIDFGILADGTPYIVMEYLVGEDLGSLLAREGKLPVGRATDLCLQACRGMEAAHAAGIVHRDLKPENLFVCRREDGTDLVKVLDFGIAKLEQLESNNAATRTGAILGTPAYMSPEQARGEKTIDHRTDIYALAAILFEMLSGTKPHPGGSHNAILHHISTQPAIPLRSVEPALPEPLPEAVERALSSDPNQRHVSVRAFAQTLAPFAMRVVWPPAKASDRAGDTTPSTDVPSSTPRERLAAASGDTVENVDLEGSTAAAAASPVAHPGRWRERRRRLVVVGAGLVATSAIAIALAIGMAKPRPAPAPALPSPPPQAIGDRTLPRDTRFFVPPPMPGAVQQIAALVKQKAFLDAAPLTAMEATPQAVWFTGGTPDDVRGAIQTTIVRAAPEHRVPILVAYNIPFRDCAQFSAGGAPSIAAYEAWIDGFGSGIGNARVVVILEPDSLGIIPHNTSLDGASDWCNPTTTDARGQTIPAPDATPAERYAALNYALDSIATKAPNASVYLDGTHAGWLGVGEIAHRLLKAGVQRAQGFFVNVANFQPTPRSIQVATWISKCIYYASSSAEGGRHLGRTGDCASQPTPASPNDAGTWAQTEKWYVDHVDRAPNPPPGPWALTHFVIDTSRNGRGAPDVARFAAAPYNQPADVIKGLTAGYWCNTPHAGLGPRPTADTGIPLADAFLWVKVPGGSDGACDIAGGARAWDYARYNPWGIGADAQNHFDPLWGTVDPGAGEWFAEEALQLARNATPPLEGSEPNAIAQAREHGDSRGDVTSESDSGHLQIPAGIERHADASEARPALARKRAVSPSGRPSGRPGGRPAAPQSPVLPNQPARVTFDPQNPYGN